MSSTSLSTAILNLSPQFYYKCDETSGTTIVNYGSVSNANLTLSGSYVLSALPLIDGDATKFISFTSGTAKAQSPLTQYFGTIIHPINYSWTVVGITSSPTQDLTTLLSVGGTGETTTTNWQLLCAITSDTNGYKGRSYWEYGASGTNEGPYSSTNAIVNNKTKPTFFCIRKNSTTQTVEYWADGVYMDSISYTNEPTGGGSATFNLNDSNDTGDGGLQTIGHVAFFNSALSNADIATLTTEANTANMNLYSTIYDTDLKTTYLNELDTDTFYKTLQVAIDPLLDQSIVLNLDRASN